MAVEYLAEIPRKGNAGALPPDSPPGSEIWALALDSEVTFDQSQNPCAANKGAKKRQAEARPGPFFPADPSVKRKSVSAGIYPAINFYILSSTPLGIDETPDIGDRSSQDCGHYRSPQLHAQDVTHNLPLRIRTLR